MKTTISIPEDLWKQFSIKVIQKHGTRKNNQVLMGLIQDWLNRA